MKTVVIAAGYATRLGELTRNFPKPLLPIGATTILDRLIDDIDQIPDITAHIIVTNHKYYPHFQQWASAKHTAKPITLVDDGTESNETRLGAVRDLLLAIEAQQLDEDLLVIAADNILDFSFRGFVEAFHAKRTSMIMCHYEPSLKALQKTGVIAVDADFRVLQMQEKPLEPVSNWAVPPFYIYRKEDLPLIKSCLSHGCGYDAPGNLAHYLCDVTTLHAWEMPGSRHDIGDRESYEAAQRLFS